MKPYSNLHALLFSLSSRHFQLPDSITRQAQRLRQRCRRVVPGPRLCSYRTQAVVDDRSRCAKLFTFVAGQTSAIHLQHLGKRRLRLRPTRLANQLSLRLRKLGEMHWGIFAITARQCNNNTALEELASTIAPAIEMARRTPVIDLNARTSSAFAPLAASRR